MERIVGIIGLGIMGSAIARNLVDRTWTVVGYDHAPDARQRMAAGGVQIVASAAEVARGAPILLTSLPDAASAKAVADEIAGSGAPPRIVAETSTLAIVDKDACAATLDAAGHRVLDCPLSGTGAQALARDLVVYASGDSAAIAEAMPMFLDFAREAADVGPFGNGSRMKFVANLLVAIHNVAAAEAVILARRAGLDLEQVLALVGAGAGGSRMFQMRAPLMVSGAYEPATMRLSTWKKDMDVIAAFATALDAPTPLFSATAPIYEEALRRGLGACDTAAVYRVLDDGGDGSGAS